MFVEESHGSPVKQPFSQLGNVAWSKYRRSRKSSSDTKSSAENEDGQTSRLSPSISEARSESFSVYTYAH